MMKEAVGSTVTNVMLTKCARSPDNTDAVVELVNK